MSKIYLHQAPVISNDEIARDIYSLKLYSPEIAAENDPGQFINIQTNPAGEPLWRRPFSIARISEHVIEIIYKAIGIGTNQMAALKEGESADIIGPLGNAFTTDIDEDVIPLIIGGGLGFAPLIILRDHFVQKGDRPALFMGAMTEEEHYYTSDNDADLYLSSDDGSLGYHGFITDLFTVYLSEQDENTRYQAYSCGPEPMMAKLAQICREWDIPLELSIEREMACGIGLCQGCAIEQKPPHKKYALVCKDGPIFNANRLAFVD